MTRLVGIYGASGFGREVAPLVKQQAGDAHCVFIDDGKDGSTVNRLPVYSFAAFRAIAAKDKSVTIAIADSRLRERLTRTVEDAGMSMLTVTAADVIAMDDVRIGPGAIMCPRVTLTSNILVGQSFQANIYSYIAHDCVIGDFVTFAPRVNCNGNVTIGDHAYIGTGAVLRQGITIGAGAVVGMGAVITKDVAPGETVVGNPARPMTKA